MSAKILTFKFHKLKTKVKKYFYHLLFHTFLFRIKHFFNHIKNYVFKSNFKKIKSSFFNTCANKFAKNDTPSFIIDLQWFAAEDEGRTEDPTEFKLRKAREKGQVAKSPELASAVAMLVVTLILIFFSKYYFTKNVELLRLFLSQCTTTEITPALFVIFMKYFMALILPIALAACAGIILIYLVQFRGFIFSTELIKPNFKKVSPNIFRYFQRVLFSPEGLFNLAKSIFKIVFIAVVVFFVIKNNIAQLLTLLSVNLAEGIFFIFRTAFNILLFASILFLVFAIADYFFQRRQFIESLKMTKQEIKEEYKELEGDPKIKGQIRSRMQELLKRNAIKNVPEADVVITNPTHLAVALQYKQELMDAPMILAKGADLLAEEIKKIANENEIPIIENKPLTRAIYKNVEIGDTIPAEYYRAMSLVFSEVYKINQAKKAKK